MHVGAHLAEELIRLAPGREQRQPDDVLVELAGLLLIPRDVGIVMQARRQLGELSHDTSPLSEAVAEPYSVLARHGSPQEAARGKLRVVELVGEVLGPGGHRPPVGLDAGAYAEQVNRVAPGQIPWGPPGTADHMLSRERHA